MAFGFNATIVVVFLSIQILYVELVLAKNLTNSTNKPTDKILHPATRTEPTSLMLMQQINVDHQDDFNKNQNNGANHGVTVRYVDTLANTSNIKEVQDHETGQLQMRVKRFIETAEETRAREDREHNTHLLVMKLEREASQRQDRQRKVRDRLQKELNTLNSKAWKMQQKAKDEQYLINKLDYAAKSKIRRAKEAKRKKEKERLKQLRWAKEKAMYLREENERKAIEEKERKEKERKEREERRRRKFYEDKEDEEYKANQLRIKLDAEASRKRDKATAEREQRDRERMLQSEKNLKEMRENQRRVPKKANRKSKKRKQKKKKQRGKAKNGKKKNKQVNKTKSKKKKKGNKTTKIKAVGNKKTGTVSKKKTKTKKSGSDSVSNCTVFLLLPSLLLTYILNY